MGVSELRAKFEQWPDDRKRVSKSATRALDVLELFALTRRPLRAIEIGRALDLHPSSIDQLLKTMVDSGYLIFEPKDKLYFPSPRLGRFGAWLTNSYFGHDAILRLLSAIHAETGELATLAVRQSAHMQIVDLVEPAASDGRVYRGLKVPLIVSALGRAYLAGCRDDDIGPILKLIDHRTSAEYLRSVLADVHKVRELGYASGGLNTEQRTWMSIAMPLPRAIAGIGMVAGLAGESSRIRPREAELAEIMRQAASKYLA